MNITDQKDRRKSKLMIQHYYNKKDHRVLNQNTKKMEPLLTIEHELSMSSKFYELSFSSYSSICVIFYYIAQSVIEE